MRKKSFIILIICIFLLIVDSCCVIARKNYETILATIIMKHFTAGYNTDQHEVGIDIIEKDDYGRILFSFEAYVAMDPYFNYNGGRAYAYGICQDLHEENLFFGKKHVSYYDNFAYIGAASREDISPDMIEQLKVWNDWNKPLNEEKMVEIEAFDWNLPEEEREWEEHHTTLLREYLNVYDDCRVSWKSFGQDKTGKYLFHFIFYRKFDESDYASESEILRSFIVAFQKNSENEVEFIDYIETEDFYNYQYELAEIKEKVGWEK